MIICVSYDPALVKEDLIEMNPDTEISDQDVLDMITIWADEDSRGLEYVLQDEEGNEL